MNEAAGSAKAELVEEFRRQLVEQQRAILRTLVTTEEEMATFDADEPGERGRRDAATTEAVNAVLSQLGGRERHELDEISDALSRLAAGTYGFCEPCGRAIARPRLRAMPATRHCLDCQRGEETQR